MTAYAVCTICAEFDDGSIWRVLGPSRLLRDGGGHHVVVGDTQDGVGGLNLTVAVWLRRTEKILSFVVPSMKMPASVLVGGDLFE